MRKTAARHESSKGLPGSRGTTVLGTPTMTSFGSFHQQAPSTSAASNRNPAKVAPSGREPATSSSGSRRRTEVFGSSAPAFEGASDHDISSGVTDQHSNELLERHTSAAKDGVIDMLTAKASKLGVSLERALLAKKEVEDGADKLQRLYGDETVKRKELEHLVQKKEAETEASIKENEHLKWEVNALRVELQDSENRSKGWLQEEAERRRSAEDAMNREHAVATEYLGDIYRKGDGPEIRREGGATIAEVLVRELRGLGETLRKRNGELEACAEHLEGAVSEANAERARRESIQEQLVFTQERFEASKHKVRQLSCQLGAQVDDNRELRARLHTMEEENDIRMRSLQERKVKAQQRKRGDTRDTMAENKAKDDRIKSLESTLIQERARLEGELQSARSEYEEAAKESRRKAARLQRRCLELEYRVATLSKSSDGNGSGSMPPTAPSCSASSATVSGSSAGLISAASMLPWRRGSAPSEASTLAAKNSVKPRLGAGSAAAEAAAAALDSVAALSTKGAKRRGTGEGGGGRGIAAAEKVLADVAVTTTGGLRSSFSSSTAAASGTTRRTSADRLPDPSRHNDGAPAWMREDVEVDRVQVD